MEHVKQISRRFLVSNNISKLQFSIEDFKALCKKMNVTLLTYVDGRELIERYELTEYLSLSGFTCLCGDIVVIFYNGSLSFSDKTIAIAHEIGHVHMNHTLYGILGRSKNSQLTDEQEQEANAFAYEFSAPLCVLKRCHIRTPRDIKNLTMLSGAHAEHVLAELSTYSPAPDEQELLKQFSPLISAHNKRRMRFSVATVSVCLAAVAVSASLMLHGGAPVPVPNPTHIPLPSVSIEAQSAAPTATANIVVTVPPSTPTGETTTTAVYTTKHGTKYHRQDCYHIADSEDVRDLTIQQALAFGYEPCKDCRPDDK